MRRRLPRLRGELPSNGSLRNASVLGIARGRFVALDLTTVGNPTSLSTIHRQEVYMIQLQVLGMKCGGCARGVTAALLSVDPLAQIETDPTSRSVSIVSNRSASDLQTALAAAGYPASVSQEGTA